MLWSGVAEGYRMTFLTPSFPSNRLRFYHPASSKVVVVVVVLVVVVVAAAVVVVVAAVVVVVVVVVICKCDHAQLLSAKEINLVCNFYLIYFGHFKWNAAFLLTDVNFSITISCCQ